MTDEEWPFGYGFCCCGCGERTGISTGNDAYNGYIKGEPIRYIVGHSTRISWAALPEIFWSRVNQDDPNGCWPWTGRVVGGYGQVSVEGKQYRANRIAWILTSGEIPDGLLVRHLCNNPSCCNPNHLALGTQRDNVDDMTRAGRQARGEGHGMAALTDEQVLEIYARCTSGIGGQRGIAKDYGVSQYCVSCIATGRTHSYLTGAGREIE